MNSIDANELLGRMKTLASMAQNQAVEAPQQTTQPFNALLDKAVNSVNELSQNASDLVTRFEHHDPNVNISEVMVALQKSSLSFQAMTQVRNHLVNAYQDIMNMPV